MSGDSAAGTKKGAPPLLAVISGKTQKANKQKGLLCACAGAGGAQTTSSMWGGAIQCLKGKVANLKQKEMSYALN